MEMGRDGERKREGKKKRGKKKSNKNVSCSVHEIRKASSTNLLRLATNVDRHARVAKLRERWRIAIILPLNSSLLATGPGGTRSRGGDL